ncbi:hypothetical protein [Acinetobacter larvae]|uniref:Uncharacterized protein n=1 Tax=Acinetobacter larvae TaxID=1789224 RepID=A0A1B2M0D0_9GAMM|nr:hypothetical protein [Acinetobacter larvae]AOA58640.1 hypothetical protein BFG52_09935 [Acinetobacter larvae]
MSQVKRAKLSLNLPLPSQQLKQQAESEQSTEYNHVRPKPKAYADRTWAPPRGTRRSMGKR